MVLEDQQASVLPAPVTPKELDRWLSELPTPPAGLDVDVVTVSDGARLEITPRGRDVWPWLLLAGGWMAMTVVFLTIMMAEMPANWFVQLFLCFLVVVSAAGCALGGAWILWMDKLVATITPTQIQVRDYGRSTPEPADVESVRLVRSRELVVSVNIGISGRKPVTLKRPLRLEVLTQSGEVRRICSGFDDDDRRWIAQLLCRLLSLPEPREDPTRPLGEQRPW